MIKNNFRSTESGLLINIVIRGLKRKHQLWDETESINKNTILILRYALFLYFRLHF